MKKRIMTVICLVLVAFVLLVPIPLRYKDGGTVKYSALLYSVTNVHSIVTQYVAEGKYKDGYEVGTIVRVLGFEVYNDVREVYEGE
ncbi:MAG: hypothetical protein IJ427_04965 [Lachnospiraceae bacterium]|nr:hypothetical protein [Lachnospiraceae bacterium]MBQ8846488.1 hypothetical protein [Lachnospiraceae bacterium]